MSNPVETLFARLRAERRAAFVPFAPAGDPDLAFTADILPALAGAVADLIELGVPFSDPVADGPVIQAAYTRALSNGFKLGAMFDTVRAVTAAPGFATPVVAMASYSLVWKRGPERFVSDCLAAGLAGAVVPDLPVEEADLLARISRDRGFALTLLVTPTTAPDRAARVAAACTGFVYVVSVVGITGAQQSSADAVAGMLERLRGLTDRPLCVGFGVTTPEHVAALKDVADGVIVGTAIVKRLAVAADPARRAEALADVARFARALRAPLG